jgi:hypothetical protein
VRAIVVREAGDPSVLRLEELPAPSPGPGEVTIDGIWDGSRTVFGLSLGATAHLVAPRIQAALHGLVDLLARGALDEPAPAVAALGDAAAVHQAFADRAAPPKTVLDVSA